MGAGRAERVVVVGRRHGRPRGRPAAAGFGFCRHRPRGAPAFRRSRVDRRGSRRAARSRRFVGARPRRQSTDAVVREARRRSRRVAGRAPADRQARDGADARGPAPPRGDGAPGLQGRDRMGELEEQGDGPCERPALDLGEAGGRAAAACRMAAGDRQARGGDLRRDERGRAERTVGSGVGRGMVPDRGTRSQCPAQGRLPGADRRCGTGARHPPWRDRRADRLDRRRRHGRSCKVASVSPPTGR